MEQLDTRTRLLDVAEELFAEKGIGSTSLRKIIAEAGVNLASIHYHFGSKEALAWEVFARRIKPVNAERLQRLDRIEERSGETPPNLEELIRAFIEPAIRIKFDEPERTKLILRLVAQLQSDSGNLGDHFVDLFEEVATRFIAAFQAALSQHSHAELYWRFKFMLGVMHMIMAQPPVQESKIFSPPELDLESILAHVIPFLVAGFKTPTLNVLKQE
ncbi:TetR family transcriptional regulator [candidate division KSB1 bacterium]|nr:TetR family transcriptional regulator [candidate division KSB1 bacterium]